MAKNGPLKWFELLHPIYRALMSMIVVVAAAVFVFSAMQNDIEANADGVRSNAEQIKVLTKAVQRQATAQAVTNTKIDAAGERNNERYETIKDALARIEGRQRLRTVRPPN